MTADKIATQFYLISDERGSIRREAMPLAFGLAFERATSLSKPGSNVRVVCREDASQSELSEFASKGIQTSSIAEP